VLLSPKLMSLMSDSAWAGKARANFWATQDWANLKRATEARYTLRRRHWPEEPYLHECMADLSATLPRPPIVPFSDPPNIGKEGVYGRRTQR
jgi:hypothetical protein